MDGALCFDEEGQLRLLPTNVVSDAETLRQCASSFATQFQDLRSLLTDVLKSMALLARDIETQRMAVLSMRHRMAAAANAEQHRRAAPPRIIEKRQQLERLYVTHKTNASRNGHARDYLRRKKSVLCNGSRRNSINRWRIC